MPGPKRGRNGPGDHHHARGRVAVGGTGGADRTAPRGKGRHHNHIYAHLHGYNTEVGGASHALTLGGGRRYDHTLLKTLLEGPGGRRGGGAGGAGAPAAAAAAATAPSSYTAHLTPEAAAEGVAAGRLVVGYLHISTDATSAGFAAVHGVTPDLFLDGVVARNRALEGDLVVVSLAPADSWLPSAVVADSEADSGSDTEAPAAAAAAGAGGGAGGASDDPYAGFPPAFSAATATAAYRDALAALEAASKGGSVQPRGTVVAIAAKLHPRTAVGVLRPLSADAATFVRMPVEWGREVYSTLCRASHHTHHPRHPADAAGRQDAAHAHPARRRAGRRVL